LRIFLLPQGPEGGADLGGEERRLLPGGEVAAFVEPFVSWSYARRSSAERPAEGEPPGSSDFATSAGLIADRFPIRPPGRRETPAQINQVRLWHVDAERADRLLSVSLRRMQGQQASSRRRGQTNRGRG
jgi:hypothetical protein